jgi:hypothetical protein
MPGGPNRAEVKVHRDTSRLGERESVDDRVALGHLEKIRFDLVHDLPEHFHVSLRNSVE